MLPVGTLGKALPHLRRPFAPAAVKFKVQTEWGTGGIVVAYIDARVVIERLNAVVGGEWEDDYTDMSGGSACALTVCGRTRRDVGAGAFLKASRSDALKRAAVKFGVGVSIYALKQVKMNTGSGEKELRTRKVKDKKTGQEKQVPVMDDVALAYLRSVYGAWLGLEHGGGAFGRVLEHGDMEDAQGDPDELVSQDLVAVDDSPQVDSEDAEELRAGCSAAFKALRARAPRKLMPAEFHRRLLEAGVSEDALRNFKAELEAM